MGLIGWSWVFLAFYVGLMIAFGVIGHRKVSNADEFATARGGYGPLFWLLRSRQRRLAVRRLSVSLE